MCASPWPLPVPGLPQLPPGRIGVPPSPSPASFGSSPVRVQSDHPLPTGPSGQQSRLQND